MAAFRGFSPRISGQPESRRRWPLCLRRTARSRLRFVMVTLAVAAFETRRGLWLLPPAFCLGQRPRRLRDGLGELRAITGG